MPKAAFIVLQDYNDLDPAAFSAVSLYPTFVIEMYDNPTLLLEPTPRHPRHRLASFVLCDARTPHQDDHLEGKEIIWVKCSQRGEFDASDHCWAMVQRHDTTSYAKGKVQASAGMEVTNRC